MTTPTQSQIADVLDELDNIGHWMNAEAGEEWIMTPEIFLDRNKEIIRSLLNLIAQREVKK